MNIAAPLHPRTTSAADGLRRRAFSVADVERMVQVGLIGPDERIELIGGEIVPMSPKGIRHKVVKQALLEFFEKALPNNLAVISETTLRLAAETYLEPDLTVYRREDGLQKLSGGTALLVVEIADWSLSYDLGRKPAIYAAFGVRELWVIDAARRVTHVHREPTPLGYRDVVDRGSDEALRPQAIPELSLILDALELDRA
jgi:Uma2 family endonuclease